MPNAADMQWFKENFHPPTEAAIAGTPFTLDLLVAIACQETGHIWSVLRKKPLTLDQILALCVGDTLDAPNRSAFPKTKTALLAQPRGDDMFRIARKALEDMAEHIPGFPVSNPNKFCHGYGMFQYDLQFFLEDPDYFLEKRYEKFGETLAKCVKELTAKAKKIRLLDKLSLDDMELTAVAIAYNTGTFKPAMGLKQGHFNGSRFYGEEIFDFIRLSRTVPVPGGAPIWSSRRQATRPCRRRRRWQKRPDRSSKSICRSHRCACAANQEQHATHRQRDRTIAGRSPGTRRHWHRSASSSKSRPVSMARTFRVSQPRSFSCRRRL